MVDFALDRSTIYILWSLFVDYMCKLIEQAFFRQPLLRNSEVLQSIVIIINRQIMCHFTHSNFVDYGN